LTNTYKKVKLWRYRTKERMVKSFGGICCICKKEYEMGLFDFHHLDPEKKEFKIGSIRGKSWEKITKELRKCVMLCSNCHRLVHYYNKKIPDDANRFNEDFVDYEIPKLPKYSNTPCPICNSEKVLRNGTYCSKKCRDIGNSKVKNKPSNEEILKLVNENGYSKTGRIFGVTGNAVKKWIKKIDQK